MKKTTYTLCLFLITTTLFASDTTKVQVHDHVDITWYGSYDQWGEFPEAQSWRKVLMHYTMGCASTGCSHWDYTTNIEILHPTGNYDSTLVLAPSIQINGSTQDTIAGSTTPTETTTFDWSTLSTQYTINDSIELVLYNNPQDPSQPTDTTFIWPSDYENYLYNIEGNIIDTIELVSDTVFYTSFTETYDVYEIIENYEMARVITPYGTYMDQGTNGYNNNWEHTFTFDVTDYAHLLQDSVEIRAFFSGWSSGFSVTLDFDFISGLPPRQVIKLENIYNGSWNYNTSLEFESNYLTEKTVFIDPSTNGAMFRFIPSGHGFDNSMSAAEFTNKNYYVNINGAQVATQSMWRNDCGLNPVFPQGGTWLYDRANWCPGDVVLSYDHEITPHINSGDSLNIDIDIQSYNWGPYTDSQGVVHNQTPSYIIDGQLFQYSEPNFNIDAEMIEIISPSLTDAFSRMNPVCGKVTLKIRNSGESPLTSATIKYRVLGTTWNSFEWTGNLAFLEEEIITLPMEGPENWLSWWGEENTFEAIIQNPNNTTDENPENDWTSSKFEVVPSYPNEFEVWFKTNSAYWETSWTIQNTQGDVLYENPSNLSASTIYKDTVQLEDGCYLFKVEDTGKDGLDFWADTDSDDGYIKLKESGAGFFITGMFEEDFGTEITHYFTVGYKLKEQEPNPYNQIEIYPNPNSGEIIIEIKEMFSNAEIEIYDILGNNVFKTSLFSEGETQFNIVLPEIPNGVYFAVTHIGQKAFSNKIIIAK